MIVRTPLSAIRASSAAQNCRFLQRGFQLRGDPVAHTPTYVARRSGNDVGAILNRVS